MNKKWIVAIFALIVAGLITVKYLRPSQSVEHRASLPEYSRSQPEVPVPTSNDTALVPAYYENPPGGLPLTLAPEKFPGKTRAAYQAAKDIPQTLAYYLVIATAIVAWAIRVCTVASKTSTRRTATCAPMKR